MKAQKKYILDYRVIVKPDKRIGSNKPCYVAYCPTLDVVDDGDTLEEALDNIRSLIVFHLKCLQEEGKEVPVDRPEELITNTQTLLNLIPRAGFAVPVGPQMIRSLFIHHSLT